MIVIRKSQYLSIFVFILKCFTTHSIKVTKRNRFVILFNQSSQFFNRLLLRVQAIILFRLERTQIERNEIIGRKDEILFHEKEKRSILLRKDFSFFVQFLLWPFWQLSSEQSPNQPLASQHWGLEQEYLTNERKCSLPKLGLHYRFLHKEKHEIRKPLHK